LIGSVGLHVQQLVHVFIVQLAKPERRLRMHSAAHAELAEGSSAGSGKVGGWMAG
jgi:hypothetical protein